MSENESFNSAMPDSVPYSLGTQNARIGGLDTRVESLERSTERLTQDVGEVKQTLATINQRLKTIEDIDKKVGKLQEEASEYRGYWKGVGHSVKFGQWVGSILFTIIGGLLMFLINKVFLGE